MAASFCGHDTDNRMYGRGRLMGGSRDSLDRVAGFLSR